MRPFFKGHVVERQPEMPLIITVDTTKAGSASTTFILPIQKTTAQVVKIDWGDGKNDLGVNGDNTHVYAESGVYTIKIYSKIFTGLYFNNAVDKSKILSVATFGKVISTSLFEAFYGCNNLASIQFGGIIYLATSAASMLRNCSVLTSAPVFDFAKVVVTSNMFQSCSLITTIPLFNTANVVNTANMFQNCTALTTVPLLDLSKVTSCSSMFQSCTALTTVPLLDLSKVTNATNMFAGTTLTTASYSDFLINLATLSLQSGVTFSGGNSKYNAAGATARAYIISTFGWTITDGGAAP